MNIIVKDALILTLEQYKGKVLLYDNYIYVIKNFKVETVEKQVKVSVFSKATRAVKEKHLVAINVQGYSKEGKFIGYLAESAVAVFLDQSNLYRMRQNWQDFKDMLKAFGFDVVPVVKEVAKECPKCGQEALPVTPVTQPETEEKMKCSKSPDGRHQFGYDGNTCSHCGIDIVCL